MGQSPPSETYNDAGEGLPFFQGRKDFGLVFPTPTKHCTAPTRTANAGDTLVSVRAPVGDANVATSECALGRGVAALRHHSGSSVFTYASARALSPEFDQFNGEGTVFGSINKTAFQSLSVITPPETDLIEYVTVCGPMLERLLIAHEESRTLATLRDALLPKLISGEIRVPEAKEVVADAV